MRCRKLHFFRVLNFCRRSQTNVGHLIEPESENLNVFLAGVRYDQRTDEDPNIGNRGLALRSSCCRQRSVNPPRTSSIAAADTGEVHHSLVRLIWIAGTEETFQRSVRCLVALLENLCGAAVRSEGLVCVITK